MGLGNVLLLSQVTVQLVVAILSFFLIVPIWMHLTNFNGHCALSATALFNGTTSGFPTSVQWAGASCNYTIFLGAVTLGVSVITVVVMGVKLCTDTDSSFLSALLDAIISGIFSILVFGAAVAVTNGFSTWCKSLQDGSSSSCQVLSLGLPIPNVTTDGSSFFMQFSMAEFGCWTIFVADIIATALAGLKLYKYHREESFLVSLKRERKRFFPSRAVYEPV